MGQCRESQSLIQALFLFASSSNSKMREYCLKSLYFLFHYQPQSLLSMNDKYILLLMQCMNDNNPIIIKCITDTIIVMMNQYWQQLSNNNNKQSVFKIFEFMLNGTRYEDNDVCCTAAEFWALYATDPGKDNSLLIEFLPQLLPVLVKRCRYTQELLQLIDFDNDDQSKADLAEDTAPVFYRGRKERDQQQQQQQIENEENKNNGKYPLVMDQEESSWNIRKCCATQLEKLSFSGEDVKQRLLSIVLPIIKSALDSNEFLDREAGLLVLGAITQKEYESVVPSLPELIPFILKQCKPDKHILVQQIACWSLARFSNWYYTTQEGSKFYEAILYQFLNGMKSNSKRVQRAACGAIATFITTTEEKILTKKEYIEALMNTFLQAFNNYHLKNFPQLIDVILCCTNVIAKHTSFQQQQQQQNGGGPNNIQPATDNILCDPKFQDALLPPIIKRWIALQGDMNIFPLFEAITQWTNFIGHTQHFQKNYLKQIFETCLNICVELKNECRDYNEYQKTLRDANHNDITNGNGGNKDEMNGHNNNNDDDHEPEKPNKEFWVCGLDLLAVLVEKCNPSIRHIIWIEKTDGGGFYYQKLLAMLYCSICETHFNVRRNGLALLGDIITLHSSNMKQHIEKFLRIVIANLNWDWQTVCTNASWCIGQSLQVYGPSTDNNNNNNNNGGTRGEESLMDNYCDEILSHLVEILKSQQAEPYIVTNIAITMARLVKAFPDKIIQKWDQFAVEWISSLTMFQEDKDKIESFETLMFVVMKNPIAVVQSRNGCTVLFKAIASWQNPPKFLNDQFQKVLMGFKKAAPNWNNIMNNLDQNTQQTLNNRYNV